MISEFEQRRLKKHGHKICIDVVMDDGEFYEWSPTFIQEQLGIAGISREQMAQTLISMAKALRGEK